MQVIPSQHSVILIYSAI